MPRTSSVPVRFLVRSAGAVLVPLFLLLAARLSADGDGTALTVSAALSRGVVRELVFEGDSILSELTWPVDNAVSLALEADTPLRSGFRLRSALSVGIPTPTGHMEDSDALNLPVSGEQTHYSRHDAFLRHSVALTLAFSRPVRTALPGPLTERSVILTPELGAKYSSRAWSARDGYLQYGEYVAGTYEPWTPALPRVPVSGTAVTYALSGFSLFAGASVSVPVASRWSFTARFAGGPILSATGRDEHPLRSLLFKDMLKGGWFVEPGAEISFSTGSRSALSLAVTWEKTSRLRGDTNVYEEGVPGHSTVPLGGGSDSSVVTARLGYLLRFAGKTR